MKQSRCCIAALLFAYLAIPSSTHAELTVSWINQFGSDKPEQGWGITVDATGGSWITGTNDESEGDAFLSRLSSEGVLDFTHERGGASSDIGSDVAIVGGGSVFIGGFTSSASLDGQVTLGSSDVFLQRYSSSGTWQSATRFGGSNQDFGDALAGNATNLLVAGTTLSSFNSQTLAGGADAYLSKRAEDGTMVWTRFVGTSASENGRAAAFDSTGNGYLSGSTAGSLPGFTNAGSVDILLARFDAEGNRTLLKQIGTNRFDSTFDMEVDLSGNIYLTGTTEGGLGGQTGGGGSDAFVMKLDSSGNVLWTRLFGGSGGDEALGIGLDNAGYVWIGGYSESSFNGHVAQGTDAFVAQFDTTGTLLGTIWFATIGYDTIRGLDIGSDGAAYVTGYTSGTLEGALGGESDVFVAKVVPEPSAGLLLAAGTVVFCRRRRVHQPPHPQ